MDGCRCILTDGWTGGTIEFVQLIARCGWMDDGWMDGWMDSSQKSTLLILVGHWLIRNDDDDDESLILHIYSDIMGSGVENRS